jgi:transposase-like protein
MSRKSRAKPPSPFIRFDSSPEVIRLVVMMYVRFPLSLRNVEDLLFERHRQLPRDGSDVVEQVRTDVCRRHPSPAGQQDAWLSPLALAP